MKQPLRAAASILLLAAATLLTGCGTLAAIFTSTPAPSESTSRPAATTTVGGFDWDWDVLGDQAVRPIQVFSDGSKTWLQFGQRQYMPAVVVNGVPVPFDVAPPYLILQGQPTRIDLMVAGFRATVMRRVQPVATGWSHTGGAKVTSESLPPGVSYFPVQAPSVSSAAPTAVAVAMPVTATYQPAQLVTTTTTGATGASRIQRVPSSDIPVQ